MRLFFPAGETIQLEDLHLAERQTDPAPTSLAIDEIEKQHIQKVLKLFNGNRKKTAEALNISEKGLYLKIKDYNLSPE